MASQELTEKQKTALDQFRTNVKDILKPEHDDEYLTKWLKARLWNLKKAETMLRESLEWRKSYGTDELLKTWKVPEVLKDYHPGGYFGHSKEGIPIWYELIGLIDIKGMVASTSGADLIKYRIYMTEYLFQNIFPVVSKKFGRKITQCIHIMDLDGLSLKHLYKPAIDLHLELIQIMEANYPETLFCSFLINAPSYINVGFNLVKPFITEDTRKKLRVLGRHKKAPSLIRDVGWFLDSGAPAADNDLWMMWWINRCLIYCWLMGMREDVPERSGSWKKTLLKEIDADQLPVHWGGTATDPDGDPYCRSHICIGGPIPERLYTKNAIASMDTRLFTAIVVGRGSSVELEYEVDKPDTFIRWNFWTDNNDIGFGVLRRTGNAKQKVEDMEVVVEGVRVNSHLSPECGMVKCDKLGSYVVRFDNTYSWVNSKKVSYHIEIITDLDTSHEMNAVEETTDF